MLELRGYCTEYNVGTVHQFTDLNLLLEQATFSAGRTFWSSRFPPFVTLATVHFIVKMLETHDMSIKSIDAS